MILKHNVECTPPPPPELPVERGVVDMHPRLLYSALLFFIVVYPYYSNLTQNFHNLKIYLHFLNIS